MPNEATKLVLLKFNGNFESGFQINLEIGKEGQAADRGILGYLPPTRELNRYLLQWQQKYIQLGNNTRIKPQQIIYDGKILPHKQLIASANNLQLQFQQWLNSPSFYAVDKHLREELNRLEEVRILICSDRPQIYQLPWCCWDLLENYPNLEIGISNFNFRRVQTDSKMRRHHKVRILAILGDSRGLNLQADRHFLESLERCEVVFLVEPTPQELYARLWQASWDIVFFAGHSQTIDREGILYLNQQDCLTIEQLKYSFKKAIASGLQLAIFNSCDGLGLAEELGKLSLPQSIVMRMPIPDIMAQEFVKHFLQGYAEGNSLYLATKMAREQLQGWEKQYPYSSWLPTIYQNPAVIPPLWADLWNDDLTTWFDRARFKLLQPSSLATAMVSAIAVILVYLIQSWGWLESSELAAYDRFIGWRPTLAADERVLVITIDDNDLSYQHNSDLALNMRGSISDIALERLITRLESGNPKAIASDVIHDFPFKSDLAQTVAQSSNFFAICRVKIDQLNLDSISAPSQLPPERVGFSNWAIDNDGAIRRQIIGMSPDDICQSSQSLSLRLALKYLEDFPASYESQGLLKIGDATFPKLNPTSGGYRLPEAQGYQTLLNYRRTSPPTLPLKEALTMPESSLKRLIDGKLVLIGVVGYNQDLHYTPFSRGQQAKRLPGVIIHAQMVGSIVSAVLGEQKSLWWIGDRWEMAWIAFWSIVGAVMASRYRNSFGKTSLSIFTSLTLILLTSWLLFLNGGWLIAIAPSLALLLSWAIAFVYRNFNY